MSLRTWMAAYRPVTPRTASRRGWMAVLKHARRYYTGMSDKNLSRHGLRRMGNILIDQTNADHVFGFGSSALCVKAKQRCSTCPVADQERRLCNVFNPEWMLNRISTVIHSMKTRRPV